MNLQELDLYVHRPTYPKDNREWDDFVSTSGSDFFSNSIQPLVFRGAMTVEWIGNKRCNYCGCKHDNKTVHCVGCGASL